MTVSNWRSSSGQGARLGTFDVNLDSGITLVGCSLVEGKNGKFVGLPQREYQKDGERKFADCVKIDDKDRRAKFNSAVLQAVEAEGWL